jgi:alpha-amylase
MLHFALLLHAHQPIGNFDEVIEDAYAQAYLPFLEALREHPQIAVAIHYSGALLQWLEARHPEYFDLLRELIASGRLELVGGGFYEPILAAIPERDRLAQLERMAAYLERHFGARPRGAWLTERVWEPRLPETLAAAGIEYTLTDDTHFLNAGLDLIDLCGDYLTESNGAAVRVIPGLKDFRYLIPFGQVAEVVEYCRRAEMLRPGGLVTMGDDLEKFGVWPETHKHVYTDGWLERFFTAIEAESDWLKMTLPGEHLATHPPLGRIYLPTASYPEMMEWALPARAGEDFEAARRRVAELPGGEQIGRFLCGGLWNNFFHKYSEANLLHKRMLWASRRVDPHSAAYEHLLAGQCNDPYWHGVFGGLYAPHLRHAAWSRLIQAGGAAPDAPVTLCDYDVDGQTEAVLESEELFAVLDPGDGATMPEIDFKPRALNAVNSLMRRPETYHKKLRSAAAQGSGAAQSIHDRVKVKEDGLDRLLLHDRYERSCFRALVFPAGKSFHDFARLQLEEDPAIAAGPYALEGLGCHRPGLRKDFQISGNRITCRLSSSLSAPASRFGVELIFNLHAPDAPDRYFLRDGFRERLRWAGEIAAAGDLALRDEWLGVTISIRVEPAANWWIAPIHTVSQSEGGFEKVYQGSMILPHWPLEAGLEVVVSVVFSGAGT